MEKEMTYGERVVGLRHQNGNPKAHEMKEAYAKIIDTLRAELMGASPEKTKKLEFAIMQAELSQMMTTRAITCEY